MNAPPSADRLPGYLKARDRTMITFVDRARREFPHLHIEETWDWSDLNTDAALGYAATRTPWWQWRVALGQLAPATLNPIAWVRFIRRVRAAKREINAAHAHRWGLHAPRQPRRRH